MYGLALYEFSVAQRIERPPGVWEIVGSNPFHARDMLIIHFHISFLLFVTFDIMLKGSIFVHQEAVILSFRSNFFVKVKFQSESNEQD